MSLMATTSMPQLDATRAFDVFYQTEVDQLYRVLSLGLGSADLASEAVDEAMTRAYQNWDTVGLLDNPAGWVYRVAMNWSVSRLRRRNRERLGQDWDVCASDQPDNIDLHRALAKLSLKGRSVVVLRHMLGWSTAETAAALGMKEGTVKSILARTLAELRYEMEKS